MEINVVPRSSPSGLGDAIMPSRAGKAICARARDYYIYYMHIYVQYRHVNVYFNVPLVVYFNRRGQPRLSPGPPCMYLNINVPCASRRHLSHMSVPKTRRGICFLFHRRLLYYI